MIPTTENVTAKKAIEARNVKLSVCPTLTVKIALKNVVVKTAGSVITFPENATVNRDSRDHCKFSLRFCLCPFLILLIF